MLKFGSVRSNQSKSSTPGLPTNGDLILKYFLSETFQTHENGSRGTHFANFLISNFLKSLTYSAVIEVFLLLIKLETEARLGSGTSFSRKNLQTSFSENSSSNSFQTRNWLLTILDSEVCSLQKRSDNWNVSFVLSKSVSLTKSRCRIFH